MKLKSVKLIGFKSFADKVILEFHEGITCIVGPNGCGKSNIADAIRWVLGEQSARSIRGYRMPDVIFGGTQKRKSSPFAEVSILFSEIDGTLPIDYTEVEITRRVYREGESEYFLNRQPVRLKDIHHLLLDTGLGKSNFSIFEQGKIDQMIQFSPLERRAIFEEAAGITRFLQSKRETLQKMEEVTLNLNRVEDILKEVESQVLILQKQADIARVFKEDQSRLLKLEKSFIYTRYHTFSTKVENLIEKEKALSKEVTGYGEKYFSLEQEEKKIKKYAEEKEGAYRRSREVLLSRQNERELKIQAKTHTAERIRELKEKQDKSEKELLNLKKEIEGWAKEIATLRSDKEHCFKKNEEAKERLIKKEKEFEHVEKSLQAMRGRQTTAHQERIRAFQKESSLEGEWKQAKIRFETNQEKKEQLLVRSQNLSLLALDKEQELGDKISNHTSCQEIVSGLGKKLSEVESELKVYSLEINSTEKSLSEMANEIQDLSAREQVLLQLKKELVGFSSGSKKVLQASKDIKSEIFGLVKGLHEFIFVKKGEEKFFNTFLKPYAETLVVQTKEDLKQILDHAKKEKIGGFSLLCLDFFQNKEISNHFTQDIAIFSELDLALTHFQREGEKCWSETGCYIDEKGVLFFSGEEEPSIFSREIELKELGGKISFFKEKKRAIEISLQQKRSERDALQKRRSQIDQEIRKGEMKGIEANFELQKTRSELERLGKEKGEVKGEVANLDTVLKQLLEKQEKIFQELTESKAELQNAQNAADELHDSLANFQGESQEKSQGLAIAKEAFMKEENELRKVSHQLNLIEVKHQETTRLIERLEQEQGFAESAEKRWRLESQKGEGDIKELDQFLEKIRGQVERFENEWKQAEVKHQQLNGDLKEMDKLLQEKKNGLNDLKVQLTHAEVSRDTLVKDFEERFGHPISELSQEERMAPFGLEKTEKEIRQLKAALEKNTHVNLAAIEECEKHQERAHHLKNQVKDLSGAQQELMEMISSFDKESRRLFYETFQKIRVQFQKNFKILFMGGEADLELSFLKDSGNDLLDAGIEITAKPPGKQMRSLTLLSGGEKCLTAMALLFAIFEVKPAPFCILDEIDAPLDDANVERFLNVVREFADADRCQFIIVTHNKRTMSLADRLYGVSMEEKGVSKLLSMEFAKSKKLEPILIS